MLHDAPGGVRGARPKPSKRHLTAPKSLHRLIRGRRAHAPPAHSRPRGFRGAAPQWPGPTSRKAGRHRIPAIRPHPDEAGKFQVLDGHHRVAILRELGHTEARRDVWEVDDREDKLLLATLNRLRAQDFPIRPAQLIHELLGETSADGSAALPEAGPPLRPGPLH